MNSEISKPSRNRIGIIQSNYIPWKGYFDFIDSVDQFVILDDVQYTRRDWRNRNKIKTKDGLKWLTVPVDVKGKYLQAIDETAVAGPAWADEHLQSLRHSYARAAHFSEHRDWVSDLYGRASRLGMLSEINELFLRAIAERLGITTPIHRSRSFELPAGKNERLIAICRQLQGTEYLSGPAARGYIDEDIWLAAGVKVYFKSYQGYPEYEQLYPPFEHGVTAFDLLFNAGSDARKYLKSSADVEPS